MEFLLKGRLSTVDLIVLNSLHQLLFKVKILFSFVTKQATFKEEVNCTEPSPLVSIPWTRVQLNGSAQAYNTIVKRVSWFKSSLLLGIQMQYTQ
jgi:hypothetical protein